MRPCDRFANPILPKCMFILKKYLSRPPAEATVALLGRKAAAAWASSGRAACRVAVAKKFVRKLCGRQRQVANKCGTATAPYGIFGVAVCPLRHANRLRAWAASKRQRADAPYDLIRAPATVAVNAEFALV